MAVNMPDIFLKGDLQRLLNYKIFLLLGDSNMRAIYKDLVILSQENRLISENGLKTKMENSFHGDELVFSIKKTNERIYKEERIYKRDSIHLEYHFITKVYDEYMENILNKMTANKPDVVLISSCLWDITRWGPRGVEKYKDNLHTVARKFNSVLPDTSLVIWLTALPISQDIRGGVLVPQLEFLKYSLRYHIMEANQYARDVFVKYGHDVLDLHYHLQMHIHLRGPDGIHWFALAVRHMSNLILTHISLAWGVSLPSRFNTERNEQTELLDNDDDHEPADQRIIRKVSKWRKKRRKLRKKNKRKSNSNNNNNIIFNNSSKVFQQNEIYQNINPVNNTVLINNFQQNVSNQSYSPFVNFENSLSQIGETSQSSQNYSWRANFSNNFDSNDLSFGQNFEINYTANENLYYSQTWMEKHPDRKLYSNKCTRNMNNNISVTVHFK